MTKPAPALPTLDIVDAATFGYQTVWAERRYLIRLAAVPVVIGLVCQLVVLGLGWDENYLRQALVMLPAYCAEGWMLCHLVRLVFLGQRWPFRPSGDPVSDESVLDDRAYGIFAGTGIYVLTKLILSGCFTVLSSFRLSDEAMVAIKAGEGPSADFLILQIAVVVACIWAFRFVWIYVGVAAGYRVRTFLRAVPGFGASVQMLGVTLLNSFPIFALTLFISTAIVAQYHHAQMDLPAGVRIAVVMLQAAAGALMSMLNTAAICNAFGRFLDLSFRRHRS